MNFRVVLDERTSDELLDELAMTLGPLLGLPPETMMARFEGSPPWLIETADRELARAIADRLVLAFGAETAVVPAIGQPSSRAAGFAAALDDLARRRAVENARRGLLTPFSRRPDPAPLPVAEPEVEPPAPPPAPEPEPETEPRAPPTAPPRETPLPERVREREPEPEPEPEPVPEPDAPPDPNAGLELDMELVQKTRRSVAPPPVEAPPGEPVTQSYAAPARPAGARKKAPSWQDEVQPRQVVMVVLGMAVAVGAYLYATDDGPPRDIGAGERELERATRQVVRIAEQAWIASKRFPPVARTPAGRYPCTSEDDPPVRPKRVRRDVSDWNNGAWMFAKFPPPSGYLTWSFESGGQGAYAWFVARAVGDLDCDGTPTTYETLGYVQDDLVFHARRSGAPDAGPPAE